MERKGFKTTNKITKIIIYTDFHIEVREMNQKQQRVSSCELAFRAKFIRTFDGEYYELKGSMAVERKGKVARLVDIYYRVRSAQNHQRCQIAKRKKPEEELVLNQ
jgi:hypothetical protein